MRPGAVADGEDVAARCALKAAAGKALSPIAPAARDAILQKCLRFIIGAKVAISRKSRIKVGEKKCEIIFK